MSTFIDLFHFFRRPAWCILEWEIHHLFDNITSYVTVKIILIQAKVIEDLASN